MCGFANTWKRRELLVGGPNGGSQRAFEFSPRGVRRDRVFVGEIAEMGEIAALSLNPTTAERQLLPS